jgi:hypothetical protein
MSKPARNALADELEASPAGPFSRRLINQVIAALRQSSGAEAVAWRARQEALEEAAKIAENGCLMPPDGGSPTEAEVEMCQGIASQVRLRKLAGADRVFAASPSPVATREELEALRDIVSWKDDTLGPRPHASSDYYNEEVSNAFDRGVRMAFYRCADRAERALATHPEPGKNEVSEEELAQSLYGSLKSNIHGMDGFKRAARAILSAYILTPRTKA